MLMQTHGRRLIQAVLSGIVATAPRSAVQNLVELLSLLINKFPMESRALTQEMLYSVRVRFRFMNIIHQSLTFVHPSTGRLYALKSHTRVKRQVRENTIRVRIVLALLFASAHLLDHSARGLRRAREAAQQFSLVARGLEGSSFGYASVTM